MRLAMRFLSRTYHPNFGITNLERKDSSSTALTAFSAMNPIVNIHISSAIFGGTPDSRETLSKSMFSFIVEHEMHNEFVIVFPAVEARDKPWIQPAALDGAATSEMREHHVEVRTRHAKSFAYGHP